MSGKNIWQDPPPEPGTGRIVLRGYLVPVFNWDHGSPERLFMPTMTRVPVNSSDKRCTVIVEWEANKEVSDGGPLTPESKPNANPPFAGPTR